MSMQKRTGSKQYHIISRFARYAQPVALFLSQISLGPQPVQTPYQIRASEEESRDAHSNPPSLKKTLSLQIRNMLSHRWILSSVLSSASEQHQAEDDDQNQNPSSEPKNDMPLADHRPFQYRLVQQAH